VAVRLLRAAHRTYSRRRAFHALRRQAHRVGPEEARSRRHARGREVHQARRLSQGLGILQRQGVSSLPIHPIFLSLPFFQMGGMGIMGVMGYTLPPCPELPMSSANRCSPAVSIRSPASIATAAVTPVPVTVACTPCAPS